jgi:2-dehydro-3-deoxyphosphogluconate aldolase/(4S)-4-hydroxy-2-oxoglutarate aldolase
MRFIDNYSDSFVNIFDKSHSNSEINTRNHPIMEHLFAQLHVPVMPVIVIDDANDALPLAEAFLSGGLNILEITFRTAAAAEAMERIRSSFPEMLLGAGTVLNPGQAQKAIDSGACFALAPGLDAATVRFFQERQLPFIPGIMTPSEIQQALNLNCRYLKFFPAGNAGGPGMLRALAAPYASQGIRFCPTGGISLQNMGEYLSIPQVFTVGGSWLATQQQIKDKQWSTITRQVAEACATRS